MDRIV